MDSYCFCQCKDTNSKAIHNSYCSILYLLFIVFANAKILIRKQFTTCLGIGNTFFDCFCQCKDTNSKAIHNWHCQLWLVQCIVFANAKILIRKQFTTIVCMAILYGDCFCQCKDTKSPHSHQAFRYIYFIHSLATNQVLRISKWP